MLLVDHPECCYSIVFKNGNVLELIASSPEIKNFWIIALSSILQIVQFDEKQKRQAQSTQSSPSLFSSSGINNQDP